MPDLQSWIRDANLDPDWLRIGADIVGGNPAPTFNGAFSLTGIAPDSGSTALLLGSRFGCDGVVKTASVSSVTSASCFVRTAAHGLRKRASLAALSFFEAEKFLPFSWPSK